MPTYNVQKFLNGLLVTSQDSLLFLYKVVFNEAGFSSPELAASELVEHVNANDGHVPASMSRLLWKPQTLTNSRLSCLVRFAGFYHDNRTCEPLLLILRQLSFIAAHPDAVFSLSLSRGDAAYKTLSSLLWSSPPHQWHVREPAILREMGRLANFDAVDDLIKALGVPFDVPMRAAAQSLASFKMDILPVLVPNLTPSASPESIAGIAETLGLLKDSRAIPHLLTFAQHDNPRVSICVAVALARLNAPNAEDRLLLLSRHRDATTRARALQALSFIYDAAISSPSSSALKVIFDGVLDSQPEVRSAAASSLALASPPAATAYLVKALAAEVSPLVRISFLRAIGVLADPEATAPLLNVLNNDSPIVMVEALNALAMIDDAEVIPLILPLFNHANVKVSLAAKSAVKYILRKPFAWPDPQQVNEDLVIYLYSLEDARQLLLPPEPPVQLGFFKRIFRSQPEPASLPTPVGSLSLTSDGLTLLLNDEPESEVQLNWSHPFVAQVTREPISGGVDSSDGDIGIHFKLRQRDSAISAEFRTIAVSLWTAPSELVGSFTAQSARLPCIDPQRATNFLGALRYFSQLHGRSLSS